MHKFILLTIVIFFAVNLYAEDIQIKSLQTYTTTNQLSFPVLSSSDEFLIIEFDVKANYPPNFNILFRFCDRNWKPTDNIFLQNVGQNILYNLDYFILPITTIDANYHFTNRFPDKDGYVKFPFSGKWRFYVVDSQDTSIVYADGQFVVVKSEQPMITTVKNETLEDQIYYPPQLAQVNWITINTNLKEEYSPFYVDEVEIIKDHLISCPIIVDKNLTNRNRIFEWDGGSKLKFTAMDVRPGNEYRQTNLQDINVYNSPDVKAQFDGMEYSRFYFKTPKDLNGGFSLTPAKNVNAIYMNVTFQIKPPEDFFGDIYLVGAFNNWQLSDAFLMDFTGDHYEKVITLKRGIYDYQYVVVNGDNKLEKNQDWFKLEGNDWSTTNEFNIFLWYRDQEYGGYDRIIGYSKIQTR